MIFPSEPGLDHEGAKRKEGCPEDHGTGFDCPSSWFTGEVEQKAEEDEENAVDKARDVDGLFMPLDSLEDDRAIEQDEVGGPFK